MRYQLGKGILALVLLMGQCSPAAANESVPLQILQVRLHTSQGEWHNSEWSDEAVTVTVRANASAVRLGCTREGTLPQRWDDELTLTEGGDWYLFARDELGRISEPFLLSDLMIDLEAPAYDMDHLIVETDWKAQTGSFRRDLEQDERSGIVKVRMHRGDARWQEVGEETLYFQGNEIITFQAEDQAGNVSEQELQLISVDEQAPDIRVTLAQPKLSASAQTVEIDLQEEYLKMAEAVLEKDGQTETFSLKQGMTTLSVSEEGEYRLKVKAFDQAGNVSEQERCFAIDVSAPSIFVSQTKDELLPGPARLQIKVREPHFIASGASLTGSYAQQELEWKEKDGWHVAELCVKEEGIHAGSLLIHDAAGNAAICALPSLVIDTRAPDIALTMTTAMQALVTEEHPDLDSIQLTLTDSRQKTKALQPQVSQANEKLLLHTDALRLPDDRYTLRLSMQDQAGNRSEQTLAFQVNRHGSQFSLSEEPFVIQERNVSQVDDAQVILRRNDTVKRLEKGKDYAVRHALREWNEYEYVLDPALFQEDGVYSVSVMSTDEAGNHNRSAQQLPLRFRVDETPPDIRLLNVIDDTELQLRITDASDLRSVRIMAGDERCSWHVQNGIYHVRLPEHSAQISVAAEDDGGNKTQVMIDIPAPETEKAFSLLMIPCVLIVMAALAFFVKKSKNQLSFPE